jgi:glycosyltransferase involved in cell wall biosynthesis
MRLLVVGHPFLLAHNQKKYVAMKRLDPGLHLRLIVPSRGRDRFDLADYQVHSALNPEEVVPLKARLVHSHMTYLHNPTQMAKLLGNFQPDVIHMEAEPQALISVETIALQRRFARGAAVTLFTWDNLVRNRRFPIGTLKRRLRRYSLARSTTVICGNRRAAELLRAEGLFRGQVEILPQYGLDVTEYQPAAESELRARLGLEGHVVVGHVGRLVPEKGLRMLLQALGRLQTHPWKLLLVGSGPLESEIRERWMAEFPGRIVLLPAVPYEQVPQYLRCLDVFVLASYSTPNWMEQFGLTLAQAMLLGIASIGSTSGAIPEVLGSGGLLFEEGRVDDLTRALESLLTSPASRQHLGARGREFALQHYTSESVAARYLAAFERARLRSTEGKQMLSETIAARKA